MAHDHPPLGAPRGFCPKTLSATLRALAGLHPTEVDTALRVEPGTTRKVERGELCACYTRAVLRHLLARNGYRWTAHVRPARGA